MDLKTEIAEKLRLLSVNLTVEDRSQALADLEISRPTLDRYLNGGVIKLDTAIKMLRYFTKKVNERVAFVESQRVA